MLVVAYPTILLPLFSEKKILEDFYTCLHVSFYTPLLNFFESHFCPHHSTKIVFTKALQKIHISRPNGYLSVP